MRTLVISFVSSISFVSCFSPSLVQDGDDEEGLFGFFLHDIRRAIKEAQNRK